MSHATAITFPTDRLKAYVCENYGQTYAEKSFVVPHAALSWPNVDGPLGNILTLCHAGNLSGERDPSVFFRGLHHFLKRNRIARARFINIGIEAVNMKEKIMEEGLTDHVILLGKQSYMETINYLCRCDILVSIENGCKESIFLPSKICDYAQTGRPILSISPPHSATHDIIRQHGGGIAVDCHSSEAIVDALLELYSHWERTTLKEKYGSYGLYYLFSPERIIASYETIFSQMGLAS
jgi:glycosyltransferase involved in cell wall biosynthesis